MKKLISKYAELTFFQLVILYILYSGLLLFELILPLTQIDYFGISIGIIGMFLVFKEKHAKLNTKIIVISLIAVLFSRLAWFMFSSVPLGYDPGWYKAAFDLGFSESWIKSVFPGLFTAVGFLVSSIIPSSIVVKWGAVALSIAVGIVFYIVIKKMYTNNIAILVTLLYATSYVMYKMFWFNYLKNMIGIILLLIALYLLSKTYDFFSKEHIVFIFIASLIGGFHRPATLLFGLTFIIYIIYQSYSKKNISYLGQQIITGICIVSLMVLYNADRIVEFIISPMIGLGSTVISGSAGGGTFFSYSEYWTYAFAYIPFALIGFSKYWKKLTYSIPLLISFIIVVFQLYFFNRFIIYLDVFILIFAAAGFYVLISNKRWFGIIILGIFLLYTGFSMYQGMLTDAPLISDEEFIYMQTISLNDTLIITSAYYSTWYKGYYDGKIIAPGLYDNNPWNKTQWEGFWSSCSTRCSLLESQNTSFYIHQGERQPTMNWDCNCFEKVNTYVYKYME